MQYDTRRDEHSLYNSLRNKLKILGFNILLAYGMIIACEESFLAVVTTVLNGFDVLHCAAV